MVELFIYTALSIGPLRGPRYPSSPSKMRGLPRIPINSLAEEIADLFSEDGCDAGIKVVRQIHDPERVLGGSAMIANLQPSPASQSSSFSSAC